MRENYISCHTYEYDKDAWVGPMTDKIVDGNDKITLVEANEDAGRGKFLVRMLAKLARSTKPLDILILFSDEQRIKEFNEAVAECDEIHDNTHGESGFMVSRMHTDNPMRVYTHVASTVESAERTSKFSLNYIFVDSVEEIDTDFIYALVENINESTQIILTGSGEDKEEGKSPWQMLKHTPDVAFIEVINDGDEEGCEQHIEVEREDDSKHSAPSFDELAKVFCDPMAQAFERKRKWDKLREVTPDDLPPEVIEGLNNGSMKAVTINAKDIIDEAKKTGKKPAEILDEMIQKIIEESEDE